jgi:hypothetical protein
MQHGSAADCIRTDGMLLKTYTHGCRMPHVLLIDDDKDCLMALANRLRFGFRGQDIEVDVADSATTGANAVSCIVL